MSEIKRKRSDLTLDDLPSSASKYKLIHMDAIGIKFVSASSVLDTLPPITDDTESQKLFALPQLESSSLMTLYNGRRTNSSLTDAEKNFISGLTDIYLNSTVSVGTEESKTDSLVNFILHSLGFAKWPLQLKLNPMYRTSIGEHFITAIPEFSIVQDNTDPATVCLVVEDKHLKNVSYGLANANGFGEAQIGIEMLTAASTNFQRQIGEGYSPRNQIVYAVRVISYFVTFYRAEFTVEYLLELNDGIPEQNIVQIKRFPQVNAITTGLNLIDFEQRKTILSGLNQLQSMLRNL